LIETGAMTFDNRLKIFLYPMRYRLTTVKVIHQK